MDIDASLQEFLRRLDGLISMAEEKQQRAKAAGAEAWLIESYNTLLRNLKVLRDTASQDKLPRRSRGETRPGAGLGLSRAVGEWCEDDELLDEVRNVEDYFRESL
jgi:hypothetical protein